MTFLQRLLQRTGAVIITLFVIWLIVTQIFDRLEDTRLPFSIALILTYLFSAYILLPLVIRISLKILPVQHIPRFTCARDGLTVDPVNIILIGTEGQLLRAFEQAGWHKADTLNISSSLKMIWSSVLNRPYPTAPFSSLYLFGRKQDYGFQIPIGKNPRKRHHIRFWKAENADLWVGAASEDIGIGLAALTYKITHKVDGEVDRERDYVLSSLKKAGAIKDIQHYEAEEFKRGKYVSDGNIAVAMCV